MAGGRQRQVEAACGGRRAVDGGRREAGGGGWHAVPHKTTFVRLKICDKLKILTNLPKYATIIEYDCSIRSTANAKDEAFRVHVRSFFLGGGVWGKYPPRHATRSELCDERTVCHVFTCSGCGQRCAQWRARFKRVGRASLSIKNSSGRRGKRRKEDTKQRKKQRGKMKQERGKKGEEKGQRTQEDE